MNYSRPTTMAKNKPQGVKPHQVNSAESSVKKKNQFNLFALNTDFFYNASALDSFFHKNALIHTDKHAQTHVYTRTNLHTPTYTHIAT